MGVDVDGEKTQRLDRKDCDMRHACDGPDEEIGRASLALLHQGSPPRCKGGQRLALCPQWPGEAAGERRWQRVCETGEGIFQCSMSMA